MQNGGKTAAFERTHNSRVVSLDVFRGLTVAAMILVTDPGTYASVYPQLLHAQWDGWTATDMIFPAFLVSAGISLTLSFGARLARSARRGGLLLHVLRRTGLLIVIGLLLNGFPGYHLSSLRIPGVLQRIGLCYLMASLVYLGAGWTAERMGRRWVRPATVGAAIVLLLGGYWALLKLCPVPGFGAGRMDSLGNVAAYVDRAVFGVAHLWPWGTTPGYGVTFDPEGLLSTLPALATTLCGVLVGEGLRSSASKAKKLAGLVIGGAVLVLLGLAWNPLLTINKKLWTSSFAVLSAGVALLVFSLCYGLIDGRRWRRGLRPLLVFGTNAILGFALSNILITLLNLIHMGGRGNLHAWMYAHWFATWMQPVHASLAYAVMLVGVNCLLIWPLYRKRIFLKI